MTIGRQILKRFDLGTPQRHRWGENCGLSWKMESKDANKEKRRETDIVRVNGKIGNTAFTCGD